MRKQMLVRGLRQEIASRESELQGLKTALVALDGRTDPKVRARAARKGHRNGRHKRKAKAG